MDRWLNFRKFINELNDINGGWELLLKNCETENSYNDCKKYQDEFIKMSKKYSDFLPC